MPKTCSDFLSSIIPTFEDVTAKCPIRPESLRFVSIRNPKDFSGAVIHHSGVMRADKPEAIANWLFNKYGWPMSYHFVIPMSADAVYQSKSLDIRSPQCGNKNGNLNMIAICMEGNWVNTHPQDSQMELLWDLLKGLELWRGESFGIVAHKSISKTACPGTVVEALSVFTHPSRVKSHERQGKIATNIMKKL